MRRRAAWHAACDCPLPPTAQHADEAAGQAPRRQQGRSLGARAPKPQFAATHPFKGCGGRACAPLAKSPRRARPPLGGHGCRGLTTHAGARLTTHAGPGSATPPLSARGCAVPTTRFNETLMSYTSGERQGGRVGGRLQVRGRKVWPARARTVGSDGQERSTSPTSSRRKRSKIVLSTQVLCSV